MEGHSGNRKENIIHSFFARRFFRKNKENVDNNLEDLFRLELVPERAIDILFGKKRSKVYFIPITQDDLRKLDRNKKVCSLSKTACIKYENAGAFTLKKGVDDHERLWIVLKKVLKINRGVELPVVFMPRDSSITVRAHEFTHACYKLGDAESAKTYEEYLESREEREAFLNSILLFRLMNPKDSFYDFLRSQPIISNFSLTNEVLNNFIDSGKGFYFYLQREIWNYTLSQFDVIEVTNLENIRRKTLELIGTFKTKALTNPFISSF